MNSWTALLLVSAILYWAIFAYLLLFRRWSWSGLLVGTLHMVVATPLVLGPWRALFDQSDFNYQVGYLGGSGIRAFIPSLMLLIWALGSAWLAVSKEGSKWMLVGAIGDAGMALNIVVMVLANRSILAPAKIQAGEYFTITGAQLVPAILVAVATPLVASSVWAFRRLSHRPPAAPGGVDLTVPLPCDRDTRDGQGPFLREPITIEG